LLNTRQSPCMGMIAVEEICKTLEVLLKAKAAERHGPLTGSGGEDCGGK